MMRDHELTVPGSPCRLLSPRPVAPAHLYRRQGAPCVQGAPARKGTPTAKRRLGPKKAQAAKKRTAPRRRRDPQKEAARRARKQARQQEKKRQRAKRDAARNQARAKREEKRRVKREKRSQERQVRAARRRARRLALLLWTKHAIHRFGRFIWPAYTRRLSPPRAVFVLLLNVFPFPGLGTVVYGKWERGAAQFLLTFLFLIGWVWAVTDGVRVVLRAFEQDGHQARLSEVAARRRQ